MKDMMEYQICFKMNIPPQWGRPTPGSSVSVIIDWIDKKIQINQKLVQERQQMLDHIDQQDREIQNLKLKESGLRVYKEIVSKKITRINIREPNTGETGYQYERYIKGQVDQLVNQG